MRTVHVCTGAVGPNQSQSSRARRSAPASAVEGSSARVGRSRNRSISVVGDGSEIFSDGYIFGGEERLLAQISVKVRLGRIAPDDYDRMVSVAADRLSLDLGAAALEMYENCGARDPSTREGSRLRVPH